MTTIMALSAAEPHNLICGEIMEIMLRPRQRVIQPQDESIRYIPLTRNKVAVVDASNYDWLRQYNWSAMTKHGLWYAIRNEPRPGGGYRTVLMHRQIMGEPQCKVDHEDRDGLNCRCTNLRTATSSQNGANSRIPERNTSGYKGVSWDAHRNRWRARILVNRQMTYIGRFRAVEDAARAYDVAAVEKFGEYARLNFPD